MPTSKIFTLGATQVPGTAALHPSRGGVHDQRARAVERVRLSADRLLARYHNARGGTQVVVLATRFYPSSYHGAGAVQVVPIASLLQPSGFHACGFGIEIVPRALDVLPSDLVPAILVAQVPGVPRFRPIPLERTRLIERQLSPIDGLLAAEHDTVAAEIIGIAPNRLPSSLLVARAVQIIHVSVYHLQPGLAR